MVIVIYKDYVITLLSRAYAQITSIGDTFFIRIIKLYIASTGCFVFLDTNSRVRVLHLE